VRGNGREIRRKKMKDTASPQRDRDDISTALPDLGVRYEKKHIAFALKHE